MTSIVQACCKQMELGGCDDQWGLRLLDGHTTRRYLAIIEAALALQLHILIVPPHCTHVLQQLNLTVFRGLKTTLCNSFNQPEYSSISVDRESLVFVLMKALSAGFQTHVISSSFQKAGIVSFNPEVVFQRCRKENLCFDATATAIPENFPHVCKYQLFLHYSFCSSSDLPSFHEIDAINITEDESCRQESPPEFDLPKD